MSNVWNCALSFAQDMLTLIISLVEEEKVDEGRKWHSIGGESSPAVSAVDLDLVVDIILFYQ